VGVEVGAQHQHYRQALARGELSQQALDEGGALGLRAAQGEELFELIDNYQGALLPYSLIPYPFPLRGQGIRDRGFSLCQRFQGVCARDDDRYLPAPFA
jgi:hypothetical protein